jgi:hypothetical protein
MNLGPGCEAWAPLPALVSGRKDGTMSKEHAGVGGNTDWRGVAAVPETIAVAVEVHLQEA